MKIILRTAYPPDYPFVFATYLRNRWFDKKNTTTLRRSTWSQLQHKRLERILESEKVLIACLDEDTDVIVGYSFKDGQTVFSYVKLPFRAPGLKIAEMLSKGTK